jgi:hypothetical protein
MWMPTLAFTSLAKTMKRFSTSVVVMADDDGVRKQPVDCLLSERHPAQAVGSGSPRWRFVELSALGLNHAAVQRLPKLRVVGSSPSSALLQALRAAR